MLTVEPCKIMYSDEYISTMTALKDCLETKTYTEEALQITEDALGLLASHYTAWCFRLDVVKHLNRDLFEELDWCEEVALENEKNYQIWNYRQRVIELILENPETASRFQHKREYPIIKMMLSLDAKNHHVWLYRNWYVKKFNLFDDIEELSSVDSLINEDARNNSAWTHRFFLLFSNKTATAVTFEREIEYAKEKIDLCPQNPSSWNYLHGIYRESKRSLTELKDFCKIYANLSKEVISSTFALEALAEIASIEKDDALAYEYYDLLQTKYDPIRSAYWKFLQQKLKAES